MAYLYKVLIVEKQKQMVHIYQNMLPWEDYHFEITSITDMEDKAIAYYGEYRFELIITDIDLTEGSGISLIKKLKKIDDKCNIVVISNHDDFYSVRDAFHAGALDYIIKSDLRYSSLSSILQELREKLDYRNANYDRSWRERLEKILGWLRDKQQVDSQMILDALMVHDLEIIHNDYRMLYFRMDNVRQVNRNMRNYEKWDLGSAEEFADMFQRKLRQRDQMQEKLEKIVKECFYDIPQHRLIFSKKHSGMVLVPPMEKQILTNKMVMMLEIMGKVLQHTFSGTISTITKGIQNFTNSYLDVTEYHAYKFYAGDACLLDMDAQETYNALNVHKVKFHSQILQCIEHMELDKVISIKDDAITYMGNHHIHPLEVKEYFCTIFDHIENFIDGKGIKNSGQFNLYRQGIRESESLYFLNNELNRILPFFMNWLKDNNTRKYKRNVNIILDYIEQNLDKKITLDMISSHVGLSEIHASRIFKKELGIGLIQFINKEKMKKAAELLDTQNMKIKEVSHAIGMDDQLYFNKLFKKFYNISPSGYRKINKQNEEQTSNN